MKKIFAIIIFLMSTGWSFETFAFQCLVNGIQVPAGNTDIRVNLNPSVGVGQNLVVDLSPEIKCFNSEPAQYDDHVNLLSGTTYGGALEGFNGSVQWYGSSYPIPMKSPSSEHIIKSPIGAPEPLQLKLFLTATGAAGGQPIHQGDRIATINMHKYAIKLNNGAEIDHSDFIWNIYANNSVTIPTGGCDVSARNVVVTLPDYPGTRAVPATVHCAQNQNLTFYLSGTTADSSQTIFANTASNSPAQGVGVKLMRNGNALATNQPISLGSVGTSPVSLGLSASYARTTGKLTAGNVQSIIGVTFQYE